MKRFALFLFGVFAFLASVALGGLALIVTDSNWSSFTYWTSQHFPYPQLINILENTPTFLQNGIGFFAFVIPWIGCVVFLLVSIVWVVKSFVPDCSNDQAKNTTPPTSS